MATVYLARTVGVGGFSRLFAVKRIHEHLSSDDAFAQMFINEARIAARIHHPGIVSVFDVGEEDGRLHIAMEYLRGETLSFILNRAWKGGPGMPYQMMAHLIASACDALHLAHELRDDDGEFLGVIHRDLSPRNMMVGYDGFLRVLDFGVAKAEGQYPKTRTGTQKGTVAYMAPEQILGKNLDRRLDIFALGIVLWESTVGKRLFAAPNDFATAAKVRQAQVPPPVGIRADYPPSLERVVMKALRREPDERYQTARELGDALRMCLAGSGQLIASTDVSDLVHRLCTDRLERRLEMECHGLRKLESESSDGLDSSGIISLNVSAALPREPVPVAPSRDRTDQMDGNPGAVLTTQNFLRDQTVAEPLTQNAEAPTAQGYPSAKLVSGSQEPLTLQSDAVIKIAEGDGTFKTFHGEPATDHQSRSHARRSPEDVTIEDRTDQGRAPLNGPEDVELSIDEVSLGEAPDTNDERLGLTSREATDRETKAPSVMSEEDTLRGDSEPAPRAVSPILAAADAALDLFLEGTPQPPSTQRAPTPFRGEPPPRTETPLRPLTPAFQDATQPPRDSLSHRAPPAPPPISGVMPTPEPPRGQKLTSGLLELDPRLLDEVSAETAPPIDRALAALASTSQLNGHDPFLDISKPSLELSAGEARKPSGLRSGTPARADKPETAVVFRAPLGRIESGSDAHLMGSESLESSQLVPMIERETSGRAAKLLLLFALIVAVGAFAALKGPALMNRLSGPAGAAPSVPPSAAPAVAAELKAVVPPVGEAAEAAPVEPPVPAPSVPAVEAEQIELSFEVEPSHAVVFVAGDLVESTVRRPRSGSSVHIEVSAPGYRSKDRRIVLDKDQHLTFLLEKEPELAPEAAPAPEPERASPKRKKKGR